MQLWIAVVLFVLLVVGITIVLRLTQHREKKQRVIVAITTIILLALAVYILLTLIFIDAASNAPPDKLLESTSTSNPTPSPSAESKTPMPIVSVSEIPTSEVPTPEIPTAIPMSTPMQEDYDLPVSKVPVFHPDVLGLRSLKYEEMPIFGTQNEVTSFVLHNFLNNRFECEFYLTNNLAIDTGTGYGVLDRACETAMAYYLFSAYHIYDMYTEDWDEGDKVYAKIKLIYTKVDYDQEAKAEALEFVMKNPVPIEGFHDFESEKAYALKVHDYIARKITYSHIGYDPESMSGLENYEALQEGYNVLAEDENTAVCAGYARAFALIAQYAGINATWVLGNETEIESHAWNVIYPCDGSEPVLVDVTWDDGLSNDVPGQIDVSDIYFYIPLHEETEHIATAHFAEFLKFINKK